MRLVLFTFFFFSSFAFEGVAQELILQCMDATGTEKSFLIFKETKKVQFSSINGGTLGSFRETSTEYLFTFPKSDKRSEASVKVDKKSGMMEFETGNVPYLSILWTANCSEIAR
jgi:hypothetical protein